MSREPNFFVCSGNMTWNSGTAHRRGRKGSEMYIRTILSSMVARERRRKSVRERS